MLSVDYAEIFRQKSDLSEMHFTATV